MPNDITQPGYLYGTGDVFPRIGPKTAFHWQAQEGIKVPYWSLWYRDKEVGLHVFSIHETQDWPDILCQMLTGLNESDTP